MDEHLPIVVCQLIISYFDDFRDIDKLLKITKNTTYIFESSIYVEVRPGGEDDFIQNYNRFRKLHNLSFVHDNDYVINEFIKNKLTNVHTLNLGSFSKITNEELKYLTTVHILYLGNYSKITNEGLKYLTNVHTLYLGNSSKITNEGLKYLKKINILHLGSNSEITNEGLKYLTNVHTLYLGWRSQITNAGLKYLTNVQLEMPGISNSRVLGVKASKTIHTTEGLIGASRGGLNTLDLSHYSKITDEGLQYLTNVRTLYLGCCTLITNKGLKQLEHTIINRY
jgi:hypothetical protein